MSETDDERFNAMSGGGPAFPCLADRITKTETNQWYWHNSGMTLRDYFAGQALNGFMANSAKTPQTAEAWAIMIGSSYCMTKTLGRWLLAFMGWKASKYDLSPK